MRGSYESEATGLWAWDEFDVWEPLSGVGECSGGEVCDGELNWKDVEVLQGEEGSADGGVGNVDGWDGSGSGRVESGDGEVFQFIGDSAGTNVNAAIGGFREDEVGEELGGCFAVDLGGEMLGWLGDEVAKGFSEMLADCRGGSEGLDDRGVGIVVDDLLEIRFVGSEVEFVGGHRR